MVVVNLPDKLKPDTAREATSTCNGRATRGERGRRMSTDPRGTWETRRSGPTTQRPVGNHNCRGGSDRESAGLIVAAKPGNSGGVKGPCQIPALDRRGESRLDETHPITDYAGDFPDTPVWENLPPKLALLRN